MNVRTIGKLVSDKKYVAVVGSGLSVNRMTNEEFREIKEVAYVIMVNYAFCRFGKEEMDMLVWYDLAVTDWIEANVKDGVSLWTNMAAFRGRQYSPLKSRVDFWLEGGLGQYTLSMALANLCKFLPSKKVLLFGVDLKVKKGDDENVKWYDSHIDFDKEKRGCVYPSQRAFDGFERDLRLFVRRGNIVNCNADSALELYPRMNWREVTRGDCDE